MHLEYMVLHVQQLKHANCCHNQLPAAAAAALHGGNQDIRAALRQLLALQGSAGGTRRCSCGWVPGGQEGWW
jgi:hypothetical protein